MAGKKSGLGRRSGRIVSGKTVQSKPKTVKTVKEEKKVSKLSKGVKKIKKKKKIDHKKETLKNKEKVRDQIIHSFYLETTNDMNDFEKKLPLTVVYTGTKRLSTDTEHHSRINQHIENHCKGIK